MPLTHRDTAHRHDLWRETVLSVVETQQAAAPHAPAHGDVLVRTLHAGPRPTYALSSLPGPDQAAYASMGEATRHACGYASQAGVDVWEDRSAGHLVRLFQFRTGVGRPRRLSAGVLRSSSSRATPTAVTPATL